MLRIGDILDGKYRILALIGKGGMSKVWLAMDNTINKEWAIKEIDKKSIEYRQTVNENETLSEIEIMRKLDHPSDYGLYRRRDPSQSIRGIRSSGRGTCSRVDA